MFLLFFTIFYGILIRVVEMFVSGLTEIPLETLFHSRTLRSPDFNDGVIIRELDGLVVRCIFSNIPQQLCKSKIGPLERDLDVD